MNDLINELEKILIPSDIIEMLTDIFIHTDKNTLETKLEEYAIKNNICPKCYSQLKVYGWKESREKCFSFPSYEEMFELGCDSCGWIDK